MRNRSTPRRLVGLALVAAALVAAPSFALAGELYYDAYGRPILHPQRYDMSGTLIVRPAPPATVVIVPPKPRPSVIRLPSVRLVPRNPYDTSSVVITGGGFGGLMLRADGRTNLVPTYRVHLGAAVGASEIALRIDLAPNARDVGVGGNENIVDIYASRLSFNHRFIPSAVIHPVAGFGLEHIAANPDAGKVGHAFALVARAGIEFAFPLSNSALAIGADATAHLPVARSEGFPLDLAAMVSFGAYLDFRF